MFVVVVVVVVVIVGWKKMIDELPDLAFGWSVRFWHGLTARPIGQRKNLESKMSKHYLGAQPQEEEALKASSAPSRHFHS